MLEGIAGPPGPEPDRTPGGGVPYGSDWKYAQAPSANAKTTALQPDANERKRVMIGLLPPRRLTVAACGRGCKHE
jgi:hypothetical protein